MTRLYQLMMAFFLSFLTSVPLLCKKYSIHLIKCFASTPVVDENPTLAKETNFSLQLINPHNRLSNQPLEDLVSAAFWKLFLTPTRGGKVVGKLIFIFILFCLHVAFYGVRWNECPIFLAFSYLESSFFVGPKMSNFVCLVFNIPLRFTNSRHFYTKIAKLKLSCLAVV